MKYVIDNPDQFLDQNEQIKMVTPEIIQEQEQADQADPTVSKMDNERHSSDDSESDSESKAGLNSDMTRSLDQGAITPAQNS